MTKTRTRTPSRPRAGLALDKSKGANQADTPGTDINTIIAQYKRHGTMPAVTLKNPLYGDFTGPKTIHEQREAVHDAEDRFMELPADVRSLCNNDWVEFLTQIEDPKNHAALEKAGLQIVSELKTEDPNTKPAEPEAATPEEPSE